MRARAALMRHVRELFELQLIGLYTVGDCKYRPARKADQVQNVRNEGGRRYAFGKELEIVELDFGDYELALHSPLEHPPLGRVTLSWPGGKVEGPIDASTFAAAGKAIRARAGVEPERMTA